MNVEEPCLHRQGFFDPSGENHNSYSLANPAFTGEDGARYGGDQNPMDVHSLRTLKLLNELMQDSHLSQRALSRKVGIALGLTNLYIRHLIKKGYVKVKNVKKNRLIYELTPMGIAQKASLALKYTQESFRFYREVRYRTEQCMFQLQKDGIKNIALYGTGEVAEIAYLSLKEAGLSLVTVVDDNKPNMEFLGMSVVSLSQLPEIHFDVLVVAQFQAKDSIQDVLAHAGIQESRIRWLDFSGEP